MEGNAVKMLRVTAWLALIGGIILAVVFFLNSETNAIDEFASRQETDPVIVALGFASVIAGIGGWVLMTALSEIAEDIAEVSSDTWRLRHPPSDD